MNLSRNHMIGAGIAAVIAIVVAIAVILTNKTPDDGLTVEAPDDIIEVQTLTQPMPVDGKVIHPDFGNQTYFSYGAIAGTDPEELPANGVLYGRVFEDGTYFHTVNLNIDVAPPGQMYVSWLRNDAGDTIKTGRLYNRFGDVRYALQFDTERDLRGYKTVIVSRESTDQVTSPSTIVAEGTLKESKQGR